MTIDQDRSVEPGGSGEERESKSGHRQDELLDHNYDGIQEFDNDMPRWWLNLFYVTIVFALIYLLHFHILGTGDSQTVRYRKQVDPEYTRLPGDQGVTMLGLASSAYRSIWYAPSRPEITQASLSAGAEFSHSGSVAAEVVPLDTTVTPLTSPADLAAGKKTYDQYCFTCHGRVGEGGIGPNLTDEYWIHGGTFPQFVHTIKVGVPVKGMIAWQKNLTPEQLLQVASYIETLRGTQPQNAKAPQGDLFVMN